MQTTYGIIGAGPFCTVTLFNTEQEVVKTSVFDTGDAIPTSQQESLRLKLNQKRLDKQQDECMKIHPINVEVTVVN